ncbi:MAG: hypothetical protein B1H03_03220 [Planctomycetales bacterium 4484_113]|nr:MAG: hypothetical protein B1H03_03220 [Planctomycetales bacterium 4484_113]
MCGVRVQGIKLKFSTWHRWDERTRIRWVDEPGVYLLALGVKPDEHCDPADKRIIYIGETCATLKRRLNQFNATAFRNSRGHAGGRAYREIIRKPPEKLFVAACAPQIQKNLERSAFIRFLERKLILGYVLANGRLPKCNKE